MIALTPYNPIYNTELSYQLNDEQAQYSSLPNKWFEKVGNFYKVVILLDNLPIGFFVLDNGDDKLDYTDNSGDLLLRSMTINPNFQGKGYAKMALLQLKTFLKNHQISCDKIILGVNHNNIPAQSVYKSVGFKKCEKTYMGRSGLQYIYELELIE